MHETQHPQEPDKKLLASVATRVRACRCARVRAQQLKELSRAFIQRNTSVTTLVLYTRVSLAWQILLQL
jgi:hypothetical protein